MLQRFNSNILSRDFTRSGKFQHACCCAIGSRDKAVSIWVTALKRPLVVMEKLFKQPILDLSWSSSGLQLMGCSLDGTVVYFQFTADELGRPLTIDEKVGRLCWWYKIDRVTNNHKLGQ